MDAGGGGGGRAGRRQEPQLPQRRGGIAMRRSSYLLQPEVVGGKLTEQDQRPEAARR